MIRKFLIWIVKNLLILLLVTFIFSSVALDLPTMVKGIFNDIFQYATPQAQKEVVSKLTMACSALGGKDISVLQQETSKIPVPIDISKSGSLCKDYSSGKINDKEFFFSVIGTAIPDKMELPKVKALEKYNSVLDFLSKNKAYYIIILLALLGALYLLAGSLSKFLTILSGISFGMGILILLPYAAIMAYARFVGFDTTAILLSIVQGSLSFDVKAVASVVLLLILRNYTSFILILGFTFLGIGIAGKVYSWKLKRQKAEPRKEVKEEKSKKEKPAKEKLTKEEEDEAYMHRDRSAKEILDELEDMHRKKMKEKPENK